MRRFFFLWPFTLFASGIGKPGTVTNITPVTWDAIPVGPGEVNYTLPRPPAFVCVNGLVQEPGTDYTMNGLTLTFLRPSDQVPEGRMLIASAEG
jgi:hypothetical protein